MSASPQQLAVYKRRIAVYRDRAAAQMAAAWDGLPNIDSESVDDYESAVALPLAGAKSAAVALSAAFFAVALKIAPVGIRAADVTPSIVIATPFYAAWHALSTGHEYDESRSVGRRAAEANGFDFVQSAARLTGDVVAERANRTVSWERKPGAAACDWCQDAANQTYRTAESADIGHDKCDCDVIPA